MNDLYTPFYERSPEDQQTRIDLEKRIQEAEVLDRIRFGMFRNSVTVRLTFEEDSQP